MKPFAIAAAFALLALQVPSVSARPASDVPSEALIDRFIAVLPAVEKEEMDSVSLEMDAEELRGLLALNPGKEAQVRTILQAKLPCFREATSGIKLRIFRTGASELGETRLRRLISFYEGPDYPPFIALVARMDNDSIPSPEDEAAFTKLKEAYPLQAFQDAMSRAGDAIAADERFRGAIMKCYSKQTAALDAAGLKSH